MHAIVSAAAQAWPPFVLVAGLLLIGAVAAADGRFAKQPTPCAHARRSPPTHDPASSSCRPASPPQSPPSWWRVS